MKIGNAKRKDANMKNIKLLLPIVVVVSCYMTGFLLGKKYTIEKYSRD